MTESDERTERNLAAARQGLKAGREARLRALEDARRLLEGLDKTELRGLPAFETPSDTAMRGCCRSSWLRGRDAGFIAGVAVIVLAMSAAVRES
jgi:hypothetical protein